MSILSAPDKVKTERSAQAAAGGAKRTRNSKDLAAGSESVVRQFLKSAQAATRGAKRKQELSGLAARSESVVREFLDRTKTGKALSM
jgi:hypothetical protein